MDRVCSRLLKGGVKDALQTRGGGNYPGGNAGKSARAGAKSIGGKECQEFRTRGKRTGGGGGNPVPSETGVEGGGGGKYELLSNSETHSPR